MATKQQIERVIRIVAEKQIEKGTTVTARSVRRALQDFDPILVDSALAACEPLLLRRLGAQPGAAYGLRPEAIPMSGHDAGRIALFIEGMLRLFKKKDAADADFRTFTWSEVAPFLGLDLKKDFNFAVSALWMAEMTNGGSISPNTPDFNFEIREDEIEDLLRCSTFSDYLETKRRRDGERLGQSIPTQVLNGDIGDDALRTGVPLAFISYSWDSDEHKAWVKELAARLRTDGVDVRLDQWHLSLGDHLTQFMETSVRESDFILLICTPKFKLKSDGRTGGVGYEGHVITAEMMASPVSRRFVPILREGTWETAAPSWLKGKLFADLRGDPASETEYRRLLEHLQDDQEPPPAVGVYKKKSGRPRPQ